MDGIKNWNNKIGESIQSGGTLIYFLFLSKFRTIVLRVSVVYHGKIVKDFVKDLCR